MTEETQTPMSQTPLFDPAAIDLRTSTGLSRRRFLTGSSLAAGVAVVAVACGKDDKLAAAPGGTNATTATTAAGGTSDLDVAMAAAGLEKLATDTYKSALDAASSGKLGDAVPPAVAELVTTAMQQHQEALDNWNKVITAAGRPAVNTPSPSLKPAVDAAFAKVKDVPGAATLALRLEDYASQTYQSVIPTLKSADAIKLAAQINVVGSQHQAILRYVLGLYPVGSGVAKAPNGLASTDFAPSNPVPSLITG
ncbi:MAG: ferritin-like domain-containing protein [Actinomycetota bacterium]|nr:ferritin-like domain-containing protein [Actinomycetota bacterium]